ncbi:SurA N-terminal domain-containing protein [Streptomyces beijiangensis]|uniref:SurA N-terminal domain-containing protein n=1 Tax=Streptomyces beijiangensis TaxID=163361 RepID=A0A939JLW2_9ACTN|nr:SurA N-terminal domain-containing protein [Streptomyces beijiangensis]MBO0517292.1 SurA N-terminal domain-containing protein [Streptomyces beijiangensis]
MHRRRRTALSVSAALLMAAPFLAACGSEAHPGAAAVVGGRRIDVSSVQSQVKDVRTAQSSTSNAAELVKNTGQLGRAKLHTMIFDQVLDRAADDAGVTVSRKEIQDARKAWLQQAGSEAKLEEALLQQNSIAPSQIDDSLREQVVLSKVASALGADTSSPEGQKVVMAALAKASKSLSIDVNPRYGTWDNQKIQLADYKAPWITQVTKETKPAAQTGA